VLAAIALAHELEQERKKRQELEGRTREALTRMLGRIDLAIGEDRPSSASLMS
jgi:cell division protein ZapA